MKNCFCYKSGLSLTQSVSQAAYAVLFYDGPDVTQLFSQAGWAVLLSGFGATSMNVDSKMQTALIVIRWLGMTSKVHNIFSIEIF